MAELLAQETASFRKLRHGMIVEGEVVQLDDEVLVDVGLKSEGVIPPNERGQPEQDLGRPLAVGDRVLVYVLRAGDDEGPVLLSYRRAERERRWHQAQELRETGELLEVPVVDYNRGGVVVDVGLRGFVPISQLTSLRRTAQGQDLTQQLAALVGTRLQVKVLEVDRRRNRLILSERLATRELRDRQREQLFDELEPGQVRQGGVSNLASFGAFVDLGGADGLVHISEISWDRINHPSDVLKLGQQVSVYVLSVDREQYKVALSIKRVQVDPWETIEEQYQPDQQVQGVIVRQSNYGAFVRVAEGVEGFIQRSDVAESERHLITEGRELPFRVLDIDYDRRRLRLVPAFEHLDEYGELVTESYEGVYAPPEGEEDQAAAEGTEPHP